MSINPFELFDIFALEFNILYLAILLVNKTHRGVICITEK